MDKHNKAMERTCEFQSAGRPTKEQVYNQQEVGDLNIII